MVVLLQEFSVFIVEKCNAILKSFLFSNLIQTECTPYIKYID